MPDNIEQILKAIHLLFARSEKNSLSKENITVNKKELFGLLEQLNYAIIEVMDMYEMNEVKKDQAKHKVEVEGQKIMDNASRSAEEIYAASIMYTDDALVELKKIMRQAKENILHEYDVVGDRIDKQIRKINTNKDELNLQLQEMQYGNDYLRILQEEKKRRAKEEEKKRVSGQNKASKTSTTDNYDEEIDEEFEEEHIKPDIVINVNKSHPSIIKAEREKRNNQEENEVPILPKNKDNILTHVSKSEAKPGLDKLTKSNTDNSTKNVFEHLEGLYKNNDIDDDELPVIQIYKPEELDAEFFAWKEEQEELKEQENLEDLDDFEENNEIHDKMSGKISSLKKKVTKLLT